MVDSSVWIARLRNANTEPVGKLRKAIADDEAIIVGDLVLMEVLMGARDEHDSVRIARALSLYPIVALAGAEVAAAAARHWRQLRGLGITIRTGIDMLIGTFCILNGRALLHDDRDFQPMQRHLGLAVL